MDVQANVEEGFQQASKWLDTLIEFSINYGFQLVGALVVLLVGLKLAAWVGKRVSGLAEGRGIDQTLARFMGNVVKVVLIAFVAIITLGNFGISIAPLIALAGAAAFGATMAIQGPLSNYGAGLSIILARPFKVGNTITVSDIGGVVEEITLAYTTLIGEDGERITVPNKEVVGRVIVNSDRHRVVQTKVSLAPEADLDKAVAATAEALEKLDPGDGGPAAQVGLHDFTYGGLILGARFWVPSATYYATRYAVNQTILTALREAEIPLLTGVQPAVLAESLSGDGMREGKTEED